MFPAACQQLVNSVGEGTLIPVQSLDEMANVQLLQLVVMKKIGLNSFTKCYYHPTDIQLTDVLQDCYQISMKVTDEVLVADYGSTIKFSQKGKVGFKLFPDMKYVNLATSDTWTIQAKFGKVVKTEVDEEMLMEELKERKLDLMNPFIEEVQENERNVLCLVTGVVHNEKESDPNTSESKASGKMLLTLLKHTKVRVQKYQEGCRLGNTVLAYSIHELDVSFKDGSIKLKRKVIPKRDVYFCEDFDCNWLNIPVNLLLPKTERDKFTSVILEMMSVPRDIQFFVKLVEDLVDLVEKLELQETEDINLQDVEEQLLTQKQSWLYLLQLAGITAQESGDLRVSKQATPLLKYFGVLFNDLSGLEDEELDLIRNCAAQTYSKVFNILHDSLPDMCCIYHDGTVFKDFTAKKFLEQFGYSVSEDNIRPPKDLDTVCKVYRVMSALFFNEIL